MDSSESPVTTYTPYFFIQAGYTVTVRVGTVYHRKRATGTTVSKVDGGWLLDTTVDGEPVLATARNTVRVEEVDGVGG